MQEKGTGGSTQLSNRVSREVGKRHERMKALLVVLAIILLGAGYRAGKDFEAGHGYRASSVLTAGTESEQPLTFVNSVSIPGDWEATG